MTAFLIPVNLRFDLDQKHQRLIFKGKQLEDDHTLFDYGVNMNDVIQVWRRAVLADQTNCGEQLEPEKEKEKKSADEKDEEEDESENANR